MNRAELSSLTGASNELNLGDAKAAASKLAQAMRRRVFVTLSENGILGVDERGAVEHVPVLPVRGAIDIVGGGAAVMAKLAAALSAGSSVREAIELANAAASVVIHQLGTTGTATREQLRDLLCP
jgi:sugar/nucleoside kinase (ribokinase family)